MSNLLDALFETYRKECPECGEHFTVQSNEEYVYKRYIKKKNTSRLAYFCSWTCYRKWERENEPKPVEKPPRPYEICHTCFECRWYVDGTRECQRRRCMHPYPDLDACSSFRPIQK